MLVCLFYAVNPIMYQRCEFKSRRGRAKSVSAHKITVGFNFHGQYKYLIFQVTLKFSCGDRLYSCI